MGKRPSCVYFRSGQIVDLAVYCIPIVNQSVVLMSDRYALTVYVTVMMSTTQWRSQDCTEIIRHGYDISTGTMAGLIKTRRRVRSVRSK